MRCEVPSLIAQFMDRFEFAEPQKHERATVVALCGPSRDDPPYRVLDAETMSKVLIEEVNAAGSVPELRLQNELDTRLFLIDGQELIGAKQNRILNTDILAPMKASLIVPVSCVEQGRWHRSSRHFGLGGSGSYSVRSCKSAGVLKSLKKRGVPSSDQRQVWHAVSCCLSDTNTSSSSKSLYDAYVGQADRLRTFRNRFTIPVDAVGLAFLVDDDLCGIDLFDRHSTLRHHWPNLLDSYAIDLLHGGLPPRDSKKSSLSLKTAWEQTQKAEWQSFATPGDGADIRFEDEQCFGAALVFEDQLPLHVHVLPTNRANGLHRRPMVSPDSDWSERALLSRLLGESSPDRSTSRRSRRVELPPKGEASRWGKAGRCPKCGFCYRWDGRTCDHCGYTNE